MSSDDPNAIATEGAATEDLRAAGLEQDDAAAPEPLYPLEASAIHARTRPRTIALVWLWELVCAFFIAIPIHAWANQAWGAHPDGDAMFFKPGAHALMSWLGDEGPGLSIVVRTAFVTFVFMGVLGQIVTGALIASLATGRKVGTSGVLLLRAPRLVRALAIGMSSFSPLMMIAVLAGALEAFVFGIGYFASASLDHALEPSMGDARSFTARLIVLAVFVVLTLMVGVVSDLARVTVARNVALGAASRQSSFMQLRAGIVQAIRTARASLFRATGAWAWRAALSLSLVYAGAVLGDVTGSRGGGALWLLFLAHQAIVFGRAALRASWLANALRLTA